MNDFHWLLNSKQSHLTADLNHTGNSSLLNVLSGHDIDTSVLSLVAKRNNIKHSCCHVGHQRSFSSGKESSCQTGVTCIAADQSDHENESVATVCHGCMVLLHVTQICQGLLDGRFVPGRKTFKPSRKAAKHFGQEST